MLSLRPFSRKIWVLFLAACRGDVPDEFLESSNDTGPGAQSRRSVMDRVQLAGLQISPGLHHQDAEPSDTGWEKFEKKHAESGLNVFGGSTAAELRLAQKGKAGSAETRRVGRSVLLCL